jgi:electron transfer flavoprotein alpha/beta subunit
MNIVVCIKQVPDTNDVKIDPKTNTLIREGVKSVINPFDENAIEEAVRLKESHGGKVTVITMGPPQATEALKSAIAMGADEGILISDRAFAGADTWATSYTLSQAIKKIGAFDLVLFGKQAIDGDTAQVGPGVAEFLDIPQITFAIKIDIVGAVHEPPIIRVKRQLEESAEIVETKLPAAVTVIKQINEPRLPSLKGQMRAKKAEIPVWTAEAIMAEPENIGLKGSPTQVVRIFTPPPRGNSEIMEGTPEEIAVKLFNKLKEQKII